MIRFVLRSVWRLVILLLGIGALYVIVSWLWPESGGRMAAFFALLATYCLMAYLVVPNLMRLFHVFSRPDHVPLYAATGDGWPSDPVNIAIIAKSRKHLIGAMRQSGWHVSDPLNLKNSLQEVASIFFNTPYPAAPLSNLYLFDRSQDIAFALPTNSKGSARTRHHVRFWRLEAPAESTRNSKHYTFWREKVRHLLHVDREIWIGTATEDIRMIDIQWRTGQITHGVSHEDNKERDFIIQCLSEKSLVKKIEMSDAGEQFRFRGQSFRTLYTTDGSIKIVHLRNSAEKINTIR